LRDARVPVPFSEAVTTIRDCERRREEIQLVAFCRAEYDHHERQCHCVEAHLGDEERIAFVAAVAVHNTVVADPSVRFAIANTGVAVSQPLLLLVAVADNAVLLIVVWASWPSLLVRCAVCAPNGRETAGVAGQRNVADPSMFVDDELEDGAQHHQNLFSRQRGPRHRSVGKLLLLLNAVPAGFGSE